MLTGVVRPLSNVVGQTVQRLGDSVGTVTQDDSPHLLTKQCRYGVRCDASAQHGNHLVAIAPGPLDFLRELVIKHKSGLDLT